MSEDVKKALEDVSALVAIVAKDTGALVMSDQAEDSVGWTTEGPLPMTFGHFRRAHAALAALEAALSATEPQPAPSVAVKLDSIAHRVHALARMVGTSFFDDIEKDLRSLSAALSAQVQDVAGEELTTEIVNLRAALKPFAEAADYYSNGLHRTKAEDALPCGPALTVGHLRRAKNALSAKVNCAADAETKTRFHIEWIAEARPPVHPKPMTGRATFETFERAVQHMRNQADDAQFVALKERRTTVVTVDRSADMRAVLAAAPAKQEG